MERSSAKRRHPVYLILAVLTILIFSSDAFPAATDPPNSTNLGAQLLLNTGSSTADQATGPEIIRLANGKYRMYYARYRNYSTVCTGGYNLYGQCMGWTPYYRWELSYRETTDTNPPTTSSVACLNCGAATHIGIGSSTADQATGPEILQLTNGKFRVYYSYYNGSYWQLAYRETTDLNPPQANGTNLGARVLLNIGSSSDVPGSPAVYRQSNGTYRLYYHTYSNATYCTAYGIYGTCIANGGGTYNYRIAYRDTASVCTAYGVYGNCIAYTSNPPDATNLGAQNIISASESTSTSTCTAYGWYGECIAYTTTTTVVERPALSPEVVSLATGAYRLYYGVSSNTSADGLYTSIKYRDTATVAALPSSTNLPSGTGSTAVAGASNSGAGDPNVVKLVNNTYRMYYANRTATVDRYGNVYNAFSRLAYRQTQ